MKIIADKDIYRVQEYFSPFGELELIPGREISSKHLINADALLVRTVSKINKNLLTASELTFVGSASSGVDHVDDKLLKERGIQFCHAPGCNSNAVVDYFFAALAWISKAGNENWQQKSVGIIGAGNVGSRIANKLLKLGMSISIFDPFLDSSHDLAGYFSSLHDVLQRDIVTIHTPLTYSGQYPTYHMLTEELLLRMKPETILINTARGELIDNSLLNKVLLSRSDLKVALDVWEDEPEINRSLLAKVKVATPHIAGYSINGKLNCTKMIFREFCRHFSLDGRKIKDDGSKRVLEFDESESSQACLDDLILKAYPIADDFIVKGMISKPEQMSGYFDRFRNAYVLRREFCDLKVIETKASKQMEYILSTLGFSMG